MKGISPIFFFSLLDVASLWPCVYMPFLLLFEYEEGKLIGNVRVDAACCCLD